MAKISLNINESALKWADRFETEGASRTETINTDLVLYSRLVNFGIRKALNSLNYETFIVCYGAFISTIISDVFTPGMIKTQILEYLKYEYIPSSEAEMDTKNIETVIEQLDDLALVGVLEIIRRLKFVSSLFIDEGLEKIGLSRDSFIK